MKAEQRDRQIPVDHADATFYLASNLLAEMLREGEREIVVKAVSGDFFYDSNTAIALPEQAMVEISHAEVSEIGVSSVLTMTGWILGQIKERYSFSLYFVLRRTIPVIPRIEAHLETIRGKTVHLSFMRSSKKLYDALFRFSLDHADPSHSGCSSLGRGKGYLMFSRQQ